jgi:hypothetical protein
MPPKFLTTFLTGQENDVTGTTVETDSFRAMIQVPPRGARYSSHGFSLSLGDEQFAEIIEPDVAMQPREPRITKGSGSTFQIRQLWEGTVIEMHDEVFVASLSDKTKPSNPDERVEFEYIELSEDDNQLVSPGSVFYWTIGTERTPAGQVKSVSNVEFRYSPPWTRSVLASASARAAELKEWLEKSETLNSSQG